MSGIEMAKTIKLSTTSPPTKPIIGVQRGIVEQPRYVTRYLSTLIALLVFQSLQANAELSFDELEKIYETDGLRRNFDGKVNFEEYLGKMVEAKDQIYGVDLDVHKYDSRNDLMSSFAPSSQTNHLECAQQLNSMIEDMTIIYSNSSSFLESKKLDLINMLDSFGLPSSQILMGKFWWLGSYSQCKQVQFQDRPARYCLAKLKAGNWVMPIRHLKVALCLPDNCNTYTVGPHVSKVEQLMKTSRLSMIPYDSFSLYDIYCLPDEDSALRQYRQPARIFFLVLSIWFAMIIFYSLRYEWSLFKHSRDNLAGEAKVDYVTSSLSIRLGWQRLFGCCKDPKREIANQTAKDDARVSLVLAKTDLVLDKSLSGIDNSSLSGDPRMYHDQNNNITSQQQQHQQLDPTNSNRVYSKPNLNCLDGLKVISMIWLIAGHLLLYALSVTSNSREIWTLLKDPRYMLVMSGIFPVDTFFTVTGFLTAYQRFNKREHEIEFGKPRYWFEAFYKRYVRIMPLYVISFILTRDVTENLISGPLWDHATSNSSIRGVCKQESIFVTLFYLADFKEIHLHCLKPAWYLACDFHFLLTAPIYLNLLAKSPSKAKILIYMTIALSVSSQFMSIYTIDGINWETVINFKPMFAPYVLRVFWKAYVLPHHRIAPYLLGLLVGHSVFMRSELTNSNHKKNLKDSEHEQQDKKPSGTWTYISSYVGIDAWIPCIILISIAQLPIVSQLIEQKGIAARIGSCLIVALMRLTWSIAIAKLIMVCTRNDDGPSFVARFLNWPRWRPWAKIGLTAMLLQWEVISYLVQSVEQVTDMTLPYLIPKIFTACLITYAISLFGYLFLEAPIGLVEQGYLSPLVFPKLNSQR